MSVAVLESSAKFVVVEGSQGKAIRPIDERGRKIYRPSGDGIIAIRCINRTEHPVLFEASCRNISSTTVELIVAPNQIMLLVVLNSQGYKIFDLDLAIGGRTEKLGFVFSDPKRYALVARPFKKKDDDESELVALPYYDQMRLEAPRAPMASQFSHYRGGRRVL